MNQTPKKNGRVLLLRHAHAAWARPGVRDFDRPLDERGIADATLIAEAMAAEMLQADAVLCSPARRCVETLEIVSRHLPVEAATEFFEGLYSRAHSYYLDLVAQRTRETVLIVGHNPMMEDTARSLTLTAEEWPGHRLQKGFPTAGLAVIDLCDGDTIGGHLSLFLTPKRLKKLQRETP